ncbi:hypothetical protein XELAEV_18010627mg, partial [Xenopus laevis]
TSGLFASSGLFATSELWVFRCFRDFRLQPLQCSILCAYLYTHTCTYIYRGSGEILRADPSSYGGYGWQEVICYPLPSGAERDAGFCTLQLHRVAGGPYAGWLDYLPHGSKMIRPVKTTLDFAE